jgi:hypothetical protein
MRLQWQADKQVHTVSTTVLPGLNLSCRSYKAPKQSAILFSMTLLEICDSLAPRLLRLQVHEKMFRLTHLDATGIPLQDP